MTERLYQWIRDERAAPLQLASSSLLIKRRIGSVGEKAPVFIPLSFFYKKNLRSLRAFDLSTKPAELLVRSSPVCCNKGEAKKSRRSRELSHPVTPFIEVQEFTIEEKKATWFILLKNLEGKRNSIISLLQNSSHFISPLKKDKLFRGDISKGDGEYQRW